MDTVLSQYYRAPLNSLGCIDDGSQKSEAGFFRFGSEAVCYGRCATGATAPSVSAHLYDARNDVRSEDGRVSFPFEISEVIDNLRKERYTASLAKSQGGLVRHAFIRKAYYAIRELLPVAVRRHFQKAYFRGWKEIPFPHWPVDFTVDIFHEELLRLCLKANGLHRVPFVWFWPRGARNCLVMTHDVETVIGRNFTPKLMDLDDAYGIKSSFQVIPEKRYEVPNEFVREIRSRGFEFNIHDLNHDGFLFREREEFLRRAAKINEYARKYESQGFRAGAMYRNQDWYGAFEFSYDMSVPNVAHLEPQRGGCCTAMPYFVGKILEIPLTATQDYSLFNILNDYSLDLWKKQLELIRAKHGLMSFIVHPDYVTASRPRKVYEALLDHLRELVARENIWAALPGDVDRWWRARNKMEIVSRGDGWVIEGVGKEQARVAYAVLDGDHLAYEVA